MLNDVASAALHAARIDNPHSVTKTQVGLGNVNNTSDLAKPISTLTQEALDAKAPVASPAFTLITPTAPTADQSTNSTQLATTEFVKAAIDAIVAASPSALDAIERIGYSARQRRKLCVNDDKRTRGEIARRCGASAFGSATSARTGQSCARGGAASGLAQDLDQRAYSHSGNRLWLRHLTL